MTPPKAASRASTPIFLVMAACCMCFQCGVLSDSEKVIKPRTHKSYYKKSSSKKRIGIGRFKLRLFERSGTKTVKMRR